MKWLLNDRRDIVRDALSGVVLASGAAPLAMLEGFPTYKIVVRADWKKDRVALISGGGSGHEPAHAGFVGRGMLTAAVAGEVFASPSVDAVLRAIVAVTGEAGCLLVVKNYTGDRLNFGLAAERAKAMGYRVEMVIVGDDVALPDNPQPRGIAGTLFVHKIAGAAAEAGAGLDAVTALAGRVAGASASIGMALESCAMPGGEAPREIGAQSVELGLGIHGEPGIRRRPLENADVLLTEMTEKLLAKQDGPAQRLALMVNNLGSLTPIEMGIAINALSRTSLWQQVDLLVGPAPLMTSLDMRGLSLSVLALDDQLRALLVTECGVSQWPAAVAPVLPQTFAVPVLSEMAWSPSSGPAAAVLGKMLDALAAAERTLNALDARSGDGDTGTTVATAVGTIRAGYDTLPFAEPADLLDALGRLVSQAMGGSSGVLMAIFLSGSANALRSGAALPVALLAGLDTMQQLGGAKPGDRTMIDALAPALVALSTGKSLEAAAAAAEHGARAAEDMAVARAGRASYVGAEHLQGHRDPGAHAVALAFAALV